MNLKRFTAVVAAVLYFFSNFPAFSDDPPSDHRPVVSPAGETIVFMSTRNTGDWELYQINGDGSDLKRLTEHAGWDGYAVFSPDGKRFVYDREDGDKKTPYIFNLETGETYPFLEMDGVWAAVNDWSPDGSRVAMFIERDGKRDLFFADKGGQNLEQITFTEDLNEHDAHFSPDGKNLAYAVNRESGSDMYIMDLENGETNRVHSSTQYVYGLAWGPGGKRIAFTDTPNDNPEGNAELYLLEMPSGDVTRLTHNENYDHMPVWLDEDQIMFTSYATGREEIYILDIKTGEISPFASGLEKLTEE